MVKYSDEQIKQIFDKFDLNHDGSLSRQEITDALHELNLKADNSTINDFIKAVDVNKDGEISFDEFKYFVTYKSGALKDFDDFLMVSSQSLALLKKITATKVEHTVDESSSINFTLKDKAIAPFNQLPTVIEVLGGDLNNHQELKRVITQESKHQNALIFVFKVQNKKLIMENLPQYCEALKAVLLELGPDFKDIVAGIEFDFIEVENGVQMLVDLSQNPIFAAYVQSAQKDIKELENFPVEFVCRLATNFDLNNYHLESEQMLTHQYAFELILNTFNLSTLFGVSEIKNSLKSFVEAKDFASASLMVYLLSMKNLNLELDFDDKIRAQLKNQFGIQAKEKVLLDLVTGAQQSLEEMGIKDFVDSMDFIKAALKDLKDAGLAELGVFIKVSHLHFGLNVKGNMYKALNQILAIE